MRVLPILAVLLLPSMLSAAPPAPTAADRAIYRAAGFTWKAGAWHSGCDDPGTDGYQGGTIERVGDLNGDGLPEVVVNEGSSWCYGNTGTAFWLMAGQPGGRWKPMLQATGMATVLRTRGVAGWPDIAIGGPGFCFAVRRWNGQAYVHNRFEYEGKRCRPQS